MDLRRFKLFFITAIVGGNVASSGGGGAYVPTYYILGF